ncbi:hypothetical protein ALC57_14301, partial [Trachymyrmex cornetzi]
YREENVKNMLSSFIDKRVSVIPEICWHSFGTTERRALVSVISRPGIILRYTREGGGGPLEGEMEHEAREARPIGAQGAFVSNSMHYIYTPTSLPPPPNAKKRGKSGREKRILRISRVERGAVRGHWQKAKRRRFSAMELEVQVGRFYRTGHSCARYVRLSVCP